MPFPSADDHQASAPLGDSLDPRGPCGDAVLTGDSLGGTEHELRHMIDTLPAMVWRADADGQLDYVNDRMLGLSATSLAEFMSKGCHFELMHPDDIESVAHAWDQALQSQTPHQAVYRLRHPGRTYRWFEVRGEPRRDRRGDALRWFGVIVDIDDRKKADDALRATEERLSRAARLSSAAELAASIAHEVNQPLAAVVSHGDACKRWLAADPPNIERALASIERMIRDAKAAADVVGRVRSLFRQTELERAALDLNEVIVEVSRLIADEASRRNVSVVTQLQDDLPPALADRVQVQQVLVNLARNGVEAMEASESRPRVLSLHARRDGSDGVLIEVSDRGTGLHDTEKVFEPFYTTKAHGMGMGLAICRRIVEAHGGKLWASRNIPNGATFSVTLPLAGARS